MDDIAIYRKLATDCLERAGAAADPHVAARLIGLGHYWLHKATQLELNEKAPALMLPDGQVDGEGAIRESIQTGPESVSDAVDSEAAMREAHRLGNGPVPNFATDIEAAMREALQYGQRKKKRRKVPNRQHAFRI